MPVFVEATEDNTILVEHDPRLKMYVMEYDGVFTAGTELVFDTTNGKATAGKEVKISAFPDMGLPMLINGEIVPPNIPVEIHGMRILGM